MELKDLVGKHKLQGVDYSEGGISFKLDGVVYICKENPDDGYRSYCDDLVVEVGGSLTNEFVDVEVVVEYVSDNGKDKKSWEYVESDLIRIVDCTTDKVVLEVGTCNTSDYYPCYVGEYHPKNMSVNVKE